ncbi:glycosyltransferase family 2 protein [Rhodovarius crocodyli]|uniref:Glycosyltransferase family 2 protein n=1 Tax=Rhodovarius crocodyli TaxID=1979269 RepID=A0A437MIK4_9PROT|nr:glycosyltransferase family A protein [Rhodovarius crocodyli]RVT97488.1 glycosyltransferase family 2 protein [Rhodovarius crocodyli]
MSSDTPPSLVLITPDLPGLHPGAAAGHAMLCLARRLAAEGAAIDLLVPRSPAGGGNATRLWAALRACGIRLHVLPGPDGADAMLGWRAVQWLKGRPAPDLLVVSDARGIAAPMLTLREVGMGLDGIPIALLVTGPHGWAGEAGGMASPAALLRRHGEDAALAGADALLFAHPALSDWWNRTHPDDARPNRSLPGLGSGVGAPGPARLRLARGPATEAEALALARHLLQLPPGPPALRLPLPPADRPPGPDPLAALLTALRGAGPALELMTEDEGWALDPRGFAEGDTVLLPGGDAVTAPLSLDALAAGVPVLPVGPGADQGVDQGAAVDPPGPWRAQIASLLALRAPPPPVFEMPDPPPLVSVCMSHFDRPALLAQAIQSIRDQSWPAVELVLVDDASPSAATREFLDGQEADFAARGWRIIRNSREEWQAAGRNRAARASRGAFILIMDDDNLAMPHEIEAMVRALLITGAEAVGAYQQLFRGEHDARAGDEPARVEFFPTGGPAGLGTVWNVYGDVNVMFRREVFEGLGGYTEEAGIGCEDYEIGAAMARAGMRLLILPETLYHYRFSSVNMARGMSNERLYLSHMRPLRPALEGQGAAAARLLRFAHGMEHARQQQFGWSYWAGRPEARPLPDYDIHHPGAPGEGFHREVAAALLAAGDAQGALRLAMPLSRAAPHDWALARLVADCAAELPGDAALRAHVLETADRLGTDLAGRVRARLFRAGREADLALWPQADAP